MEFLKEVLGEQYEAFETAINTYNAKPENKDKQVKLANLSLGEYVGKQKYDDVVKERDTANTTITNLKKNNKDNETLQNTIKVHETTINNLKAEAEKTAKTYALKDKLRENGILDPDYVIYKQGGIDKFTFDQNGAPIGVDEVIKPLKENAAMSHLFKQTNQEYQPNGGNGGSGGAKNPWAKETFNLTEQGKMFRENPTQARQLASAAGVTL